MSHSNHKFWVCFQFNQKSNLCFYVEKIIFEPLGNLNIIKITISLCKHKDVPCFQLHEKTVREGKGLKM